MRNVENLGINYSSFHLLYNGLATDKTDVNQVGVTGFSAPTQWKCRKVTFAGDIWRWARLTSTKEGLAFLASITRLVVWIPDHYGVPRILWGNWSMPWWFVKVPFGKMNGLRDIGIVLSMPRELGSPGVMIAPIQMLVCHTSIPEDDPILSHWQQLAGKDADGQGLIHPLYVEARPREHGLSRILNWEKAWVSGQSEWSWEALRGQAELLTKTTVVVQASQW